MQTGFIDNASYSDIRWAVCLTLILLQSLIWANNPPREPLEPTGNPHGESSSCLACHLTTDANAPLLKENGNTLRLCWSCHTVDKAIHAIHPMDSRSRTQSLIYIPQDFPLQNGRFTCLTCHDVTPHCRREQNHTKSNPSFLRRANDENPLTFCSYCHTEQDHSALNVHDQLQAGRINTNTCKWCHIHPQSNESSFPDTAAYPIRKNSSEICVNCHSIAEDHPTGGPHLYMKPSEDMIWYISAYELHTRMSLSINELIVFVRAAQRTPRSIPLDDQGRIICSTCHNPHEAGLFRQGSDRAIGTEPKQAVNYRLRAPKGKMCLTCHHM